jgi:hypothetical protein
MSYTAYLNVAQAGQNWTPPTPDSAILQPGTTTGVYPVNNQPVTATLYVLNTGGTAVTVKDVWTGSVKRQFGAIADNIRSTLVGDAVSSGLTIAASGMTIQTFSDVFSNSNGLNPPFYDLSMTLLLSDGSIVVVNPAPGTGTITMSGATAGDKVVVNGITFTGSITSSFTGGSGAPVFYVGASGTAGANLSEAINKIFAGSGTATSAATGGNSGVVTLSQPYQIAQDLSGGDLAVSNSTTLSCSGTASVGDQVTIIGRLPPVGSNPLGQVQAITFVGTSATTATGGTGAPAFYVGTGASATPAITLAGAINKIFGTNSATALNGVITFGSHGPTASPEYGLTSDAFGISIPAGNTGLYVPAAGSNVVNPQAGIYLPQTAQ